MGKLYLLNRGYFPGYASTIHCMMWFKELDALGIKAEIVNIRPNDEEDIQPNIYDNITIRNLWLENRMRFSNRYLRYLQFLLTGRRFINTLRDGDIVCTYDCGIFLPQLVSKKNIKVYSEETEKPGIGNLFFLSRKFTKRILKAYKKLDGLFVISHALKTYFESLGCHPDKVKLVHMTVDFSRFSSLAPNHRKIITYCGNGTNNKDGVDQLIQAFSIVHNKHPEYVLQIIGASPCKGDDSGNIELTESLNLSDFIIFTGRVDSNRIPQMLLDSEFLVLNRPDSEQARYGFPSKLGEYLATGNPVIVTDVGDIPLFLTDKKNVYMAPHDNVNAFAEKLIYAIDHPEESKVIGNEGRITAETLFNPQKEIHKIIDSIFTSTI
jgi:glycosyltransferase involved in cell wall biosynthesis